MCGDVHVVQPRETIDGIAAFYNVDTQCLLDANNIIRANLTQPGTPIVIDQNCPEYTGDGIPSVQSSINPTNEDG